MEERRTAELLSDFDDYKIDDAGEFDVGGRRGIGQSFPAGRSIKREGTDGRLGHTARLPRARYTAAAGNAAVHAALVEVDFVEAPEIRGVVIAAAAHQAGRQKPVFQLVMLEIRRRQPGTLLEDQNGEGCLGEFAGR